MNYKARLVLNKYFKKGRKERADGMSSWNIFTQDKESQGTTMRKSFTFITKLVSQVPCTLNDPWKVGNYSTKEQVNSFYYLSH